MSPKGKGGKAKTSEHAGLRKQAISPNELRESSLLVIPEDAVEGFEERIETGIPWTLIELAARHHREMCSREDVPEVSFEKAFQCCIRKSILKGFFHKKTGLSFDEQYCFNIPLTVWDVQKFGTKEQIFLFNCANSITDDLLSIVKKVVPLRSVKALEKELKTVNILRIIDCEMTNLDTHLLEFNNLKFLNLCGNYLKDIDLKCLPFGIEALELQANAISNVGGFAKNLPTSLAYLGLSRNLLTIEGLLGIDHLPHTITAIDLSDNDIMDLDQVLNYLKRLPLCSLLLAGNPCAMCIGYVNEVKRRLPYLKYLDGNEIERTETNNAEGIAQAETELQYNFFQFSILRVMAVPEPPKPGAKEITTFHVELELPLLDKVRRNFLMFGANEALSITLPAPELDEVSTEASEQENITILMSKSFLIEEHEPIFNIYDYLAPVNQRKIRNYTIFESNKINRWENMMYFQDPVVKIMCPDLKALRDTFRSKITIRLIYSAIYPLQPQHPTKSSQTKHRPNSPDKQLEGEYRVTLATITCDLRRVDWKFPIQEFSWDDTMPTNEAQFQEDHELSNMQYAQQTIKTVPVKGKEGDLGRKSFMLKETPSAMTIHVAFSIGTNSG